MANYESIHTGADIDNAVTKSLENYSKAQLDAALDLKADQLTTYTKEEVDALIPSGMAARNVSVQRVQIGGTDWNPQNAQLGLAQLYLGKASLVGGKVPVTELPESALNVIEGQLIRNSFFAWNGQAFDDEPITPMSGKIYVDMVMNRMYRYDSINDIYTRLQ